MNHTAPTPLVSLAHLGLIAVRGADARKFLNGQLSQDLLHLAPDRVELAGLHNPQGRMTALLRLVPVGSEDVLCVLPRTLLPDTLVTLRKFLLRAKATLSDDTAHWLIEGLSEDASLPAAMGSARTEGSAIVWRHAADGRVIRLRPLEHDAAPPSTTANEAALAAWRLADIAAGLPELSESTRGEFVAQMLNLDALDGISFTKGCYTGQEVIARAHYRGRVKRRVQRFRIVGPAISSEPTLEPGQKIRLIEGATTRTAQIVNVAHGPAGTECLAVTTFGATAQETVAPDATDASLDQAPGKSDEMLRFEAVALPMSYALPE